MSFLEMLFGTLNVTQDVLESENVKTKMISLETLTVTSGHSHKTFTPFTSTCRANTLPTLRLTLKIHGPGTPPQEHANIWTTHRMRSSNLLAVSSPGYLVTRLIRLTGISAHPCSADHKSSAQKPVRDPRSSLLILLRLSGFGGSGTQSRWLRKKMGISEAAHL